MDREENYIVFADGCDLIAELDTMFTVNLYTLCKNKTVPARKSENDRPLYRPFLEECLKWRDQTISFAELADNLVQDYASHFGNLTSKPVFSNQKKISYKILCGDQKVLSANKLNRLCKCLIAISSFIKPNI